MPPRRSARVAAVAERESSALSPLPLPLVLHVFSLLPADARARAACVCRGWRTTLQEPSLWTRLDLSPSSGVTCAVTDAVMAGAAGKAHGQLHALDVSRCGGVSFNALLAVVRANGGALLELCVCMRLEYGAQLTLDTGHVERLLRGAPQLAACHADVLGDVEVADARRMLRNEPPFQTLRLRALHVNFPDDADEASVREVAADMAAHASLQRVELLNARLNTPAALDAVVDAVLARQLESVHFVVCRLSPAGAPALVRLLGSSTLTELIISPGGQQLLDGPSAALLGAALRANSTLTALYLHDVGLWHDIGAAAALLGALTGHGTLRMLLLPFNSDGAAQAAAAGAALGALVAANAPALSHLDVFRSDLNDAALRPLFEALPRNTHLRMLGVGQNRMSDAFVADVLLPAVRTNTSLRVLRARRFTDDESALEAEALVAARAA
jgi:hypothetical protein